MITHQIDAGSFFVLKLRRNAPTVLWLMVKRKLTHRHSRGRMRCLPIQDSNSSFAHGVHQFRRENNSKRIPSFMLRDGRGIILHEFCQS